MQKYVLESLKNLKRRANSRKHIQNIVSHASHLPKGLHLSLCINCTDTILLIQRTGSMELETIDHN